MRPLVILLLLGTGAALHAQVQEEKLIDRILQPNMNLGNPMQDMTYNSGGGGGLDTTKTAYVKDFDFVQKFTPKTFETKDFASKDYWQGDFQFATKAATVKTDSDQDKIYATKAAPVKEARESGKDYGVKSYGTREADEKGKTSQNHLNDVYLKNQMNMDQVRELLNKTHSGNQ